MYGVGRCWGDKGPPMPHLHAGLSRASLGSRLGRYSVLLPTRAVSLATPAAGPELGVPHFSSLFRAPIGGQRGDVYIADITTCPCAAGDCGALLRAGGQGSRDDLQVRATPSRTASSMRSSK